MTDPASPPQTLRAQAETAQERLAGHGLVLRDLGVLAPEDPAAALFLGAVERGFYEPVPTGGHLREVLEGHAADGRRRLGVWERDTDPAATEPVATFEDFVQPLTTWPGRTLDAWLISDVTVSPGHRRRGILRAMMLRSLADAARAGIAVAALTASEAAIYGRFGFGAATRWRRVHLDVRGEPALSGPEAAGVVRPADPRGIGSLVDELYQRVRLRHPGTVQRTASFLPRWEDRSLGRDEGRGSGLFAAVHRDADGTVQGVALYRFAGWETTPPTVTVETFLAATADARRGLVRYLARLDLVERVVWERAPEAGWVEALFADERRVRADRGGDDLYLRVLDVPAAVAGRGYRADGEVVVAVEDRLGPADGVWRLVVAGGQGRARRLGPSSAAGPLGAEVVMGVDRFSALWLGGAGRGATAAVLADAGVVGEPVPGGADRLDALLAPRRPLHCLTGF